MRVYKVDDVGNPAEKGEGGISEARGGREELSTVEWLRTMRIRQTVYDKQDGCISPTVSQHNATSISVLLNLCTPSHVPLPQPGAHGVWLSHSDNLDCPWTPYSLLPTEYTTPLASGNLSISKSS